MATIGDNLKKNIYQNKLDNYKLILKEEDINNIKLMKPKVIEDLDYNLDKFLNVSLKIKTLGFGCMKVKNPLKKVLFERHQPRSHEVLIEIMYSGVCHSDWHYIVGEWEASYPLICGHEIAGKIIKIGNNVKKFKIGDEVTIGVMIDSCKKCKRCKEGNQQYCENEATWTYEGNERNPGDKEPSGNPTYGGFSNLIISNEDFVYKIPFNIPINKIAPLLCAGITTYWPLIQLGIKKGDRIGIAGIGGLGHIAIKLAKALGAYVIALTRTEWKLDDSKKNLGADESILVTNKKQMSHLENSLDYIISTIPKPHDLNIYTDLLKFNGTLWILGALFPLPNFDPVILSSKNLILRSSEIGGIKSTQELLDFCSKHEIIPEVEIISFHDINKTYKKLLNSEVKYRYVIDISSIYKDN